MVNTSPSIHPAEEATLTGVIKNAMEKRLQSLDHMMPVEVTAYDRATNRATVKHLIQMQGTDGQKVDRAEVASVRVYQPGNSMFSMSLPIKPGDKGWIMAADRDLSVFQQDVDKTDAPNTRRMHSFQDGLFMPDAMKMGNVPAGEGDRVVIGLNDGGAILSFDGGGFYFTIGGVKVAITAAGIDITGGEVTHNGKNIGSTHVHTGVTPGGGNTGQPA